MRKLATRIALAVSAVAMMAASPVEAETRWTMASGYPEDSFFTKNIRQLIADVEEATDGELVIDLRPNDELIKHDAIKRAVQAGQVQIGEIRLAVYTNEDKIFGIDNLPNLVTSYEEARTLMEVQDPYLDEILGKRGLRLITYAPWPGQGFYTTEPVTSLADLEGQSIRIYSPQTQQMCQMLGMDATILPFAEVPQAFSTGLIEALWTSAQTGTDVQAWDYVKYFTYTGSMHNKNAIIVNERAFRSLDEEVQKALIEAGERATERGWKLSREASASKEQELEEHGMVRADAPAEVMERMREIGVSMLEDWRADASEEQLAVLDAYLAAVGR